VRSERGIIIIIIIITTTTTTTIIIINKAFVEIVTHSMEPSPS
jgi:hypothetical protein